MATAKEVTKEVTMEEKIAELEAKLKALSEEKAEKDEASDGLSEEVKKEIARNEEYVEIKLFKDNDKYTDDVYVAVGDRNCVIKRGVPVKVKRKFYLALCQGEDQDLKTMQLIESKADEYKEI